MKKISRRDALLAVGATTLFGATKANAEPAKTGGAAMVDGKDAWKYAVVDPQKVADAAYENYSIGHCMHTTFYAIVSAVAEALEAKDPLAAREIASFPFHMMKYGGSGAGGFGSLCGSLNAAMAAVGLFVSESKTRSALLAELGLFYEQTMLPTYVPKDAKEKEEYPQTISNSILCHISSGKWCELAQARTDSPERTERCSRLSADVARFTVELLNRNFAALNSSDAAPVVAFKRAEPTATCVACHDKKGDVSNIIGQMSCNECHPTKTPDHHTAK